MQLTSTVHKILFPPTLHRLIISHHGEPRFSLGCGVGWPNDSIMSSATQILFIFLLSPFQYIGSLSGWLLSRPQITINNNWRRMLRCSLLTGSFTQKPRKNSLLVLHWFKLAYFSLFPNHHLFCAASKKLPGYNWLKTTQTIHTSSRRPSRVLFMQRIWVVEVPR